MYDLLLSGGTIITCNNSFDIIEDGIIGVKDNKISLIESKKENLAASFGGIPKYMHIEIVEPDLEIPGIIAIACTIPTAIDEESAIAFWLFLNLFERIKRNPVEHNASPTKWTLSNIFKK